MLSNTISQKILLSLCLLNSISINAGWRHRAGQPSFIGYNEKCNCIICKNCRKIYTNNQIKKFIEIYRENKEKTDSIKTN